MPDTYPYLTRQIPGQENTRAQEIRAASWVMQQSNDESAVREVMLMLFQPPRGSRVCAVCRQARARAGTVPQICNVCLSSEKVPGE
jgi:hypothetical protein